MIMAGDMLEIMQKVKNGELSVEEAALQMEGFDEKANNLDVIPTQPAAAPAPEDDFQPEMGIWKYAWLIILWVGILIVAPSALWMNNALANGRYFWFACSWLPLLLGLLVLVIGAWSHQARWAHIRIHDAEGANIRLSMPIPMQLVIWFMRIFGGRIQGLKESRMTGAEIADILEALKHCKDPISVEVDEKDGDQVRVYLM